MSGSRGELSFWEHFDVLRASILRIIVVWTLFSIVAFCFKELLFGIVLAPLDSDFETYRLLQELCKRFDIIWEVFPTVSLINTELTQQFLIHVKTALCAGVVVCAPYILYEIFKFVSPGLYNNEQRYAVRIIVSGYVMFMLGIALSYFIIFPLTLQFLGSYQVAPDVVNMISIESYMSTLIMMCLCMGVICELPVLAWLFARMGLIKKGVLEKYRRHALVVILVIAAIITPTQDVFTLLVVTLPIWLLYEVSVLIVRRSGME